MLVRLAGLYGASAVAISAYGTHRKYPPLDDDPKVDLRNVFETANRVHFFHTLALLSTPLMRRPLFVRKEIKFAKTTFYLKFFSTKFSFRLV